MAKSSKKTALRGAALVVTQAPFALDEARRAAIRARASAVALPPKPRSYLSARIEWMTSLQASASRDRALLDGINVGGTDLTPDEIDAFGWTVAYLRELNEACGGDAVAPAVTVDPPVTKAPASMTLQELRDEQRALQRTLLKAFEARFAGNAVGKRWIAGVRRGAGDLDIKNDTRDILRMCASEGQREWLAQLRKGEPAAASRLALLEQEFNNRLMTPDVASTEAIDLRALRDQVTALAEGSARRIRAGAKYQFSDDPTRLRDYKGFTEPKTRKKAATPVAPPTPAQP